MIGVDRLSSSAALALGETGGQDARAAAGAAVTELGHRILAWVEASGGGSAGGAAWTEAAGAPGGFRPDEGELARGGDVYDLNGLAGDVAGSTGASPTQEGELRRAFEDFTRAAVVQVAGLAGAPGDRQVAGIHAALAEATDGHSSTGADGVIERLGRATDVLTARNGG